MTALLFKNWGFPHKVFKGVQTFESKKIKETLQIQRFSHFLILPQTGIEPGRRTLSCILTIPPLSYPATSQNWTANAFSPVGFPLCLIGSQPALALVFQGEIVARFL